MTEQSICPDGTDDDWVQDDDSPFGTPAKDS